MFCLLISQTVQSVECQGSGRSSQQVTQLCRVISNQVCASTSPDWKKLSILGSGLEGPRRLPSQVFCDRKVNAYLRLCLTRLVA